MIINGDDNKRMLRVKGKGQFLTAKEVEFSWSSLTCDDCYIIEIGPNVYQFKGANANPFEVSFSYIFIRKVKKKT